MINHILVLDQIETDTASVENLKSSLIHLMKFFDFLDNYYCS